VRVQHDVRAEHGCDGPRRADVRDRRFGGEHELQRAGDDAADEVEDEEAHLPQTILDVVAEHPEEQHVPEDVQPSAVKEHRREHRQPRALVGTLLGQEGLQLFRRNLASVIFGDRFRSLTPAVRERLTMRDLVRDQPVAPEERLLLERQVLAASERRLPEQERDGVRADQEQRDDRDPQPWVGVT
jgi:hypothetical protein